MDKLIYRGNSMRMVFRTGDFLIPEKVEFSRLKPGDVVCFGAAGGRHVVHRVLRRTPEGLVTIGDNNLRPDREIVTPAMNPVRIVAADRNGKLIPVSRGKWGLICFFWHRVRIHSRRAIGRCVRPFLTLFSKIFQGREAEEVCFHGETCYFIEKRLVAKRGRNGGVEYVKWYYRGLYRLPSPTDSRSAENGKQG